MGEGIKAASERLLLEMEQPSVLAFELGAVALLGFLLPPERERGRAVVTPLAEPAQRRVDERFSRRDARRDAVILVVRLEESSELLVEPRNRFFRFDASVELVEELVAQPSFLLVEPLVDVPVLEQGHA